jgi:hypothetical protein
MIDIEMVERPREATDAKIAELERALRRPFPADYRGFLPKENGGFPHEYTRANPSSAWGKGGTEGADILLGLMRFQPEECSGSGT